METCRFDIINVTFSDGLLEWFKRWDDVYGEIHPYLCLLVCFLGIVLNLLTIGVLTRPSMRSPINITLCAIAISDSVVMLTTFVFHLYFNLLSPARCEAPENYSFGSAVFVMIHAHSSVIFHSTSIWLTVSLALIRLTSIHNVSRLNFSPDSFNFNTNKSILLPFVLLAVISLTNLPNFHSFIIVPVPVLLYCGAPPSFLPPEQGGSAAAMASSKEDNWNNPFSENFTSKNPYGFKPSNTSDHKLPTINASSSAQMMVFKHLPTNSGNIVDRLDQSSTSGSLPTTRDNIQNNEIKASIAGAIQKSLLDTFLTNATTNGTGWSKLGNTMKQTAEGSSANSVRTVFESEPVEHLYFPSHRKQSCELLKAAFWTTGLLFKLIPCVLLTLSIVFLLRLLAEVKRRKERLRVGHRYRGSGQQQGNTSSNSEENTSTTCMLIAVLTIFLVTELPQGLLSVLAGLIRPPFKSKVYHKLGDAMDMLSLINSSVNFIIYCSMSKRFRDVFSSLFVTPVRQVRVRLIDLLERSEENGGLDGLGLTGSYIRETIHLTLRILPVYPSSSAAHSNATTVTLALPESSSISSNEG